MELVDVCLERARSVILGNVHQGVLYASSFYQQLWTRDVCISAVALRFYDDSEIRDSIVRSIELIGKFQDKRGQVPASIDVDSGRLYWYSIDSTLWWVAACILYGACGRRSVTRAYDWIAKQVIDNSMLITSIRATDWMDASLGREGKVLYINVLWYLVTELMERWGGDVYVRSSEIRKRINTLFWPTEKSIDDVSSWGCLGSTEFIRDFISPSRMYYIHFISYEYLDDRLDTFANLLAILLGIASESRALRILRYIEREGVDKPYPVKSLYPAISMPGLTWVPQVDLYRRRFQVCLPHHYHNGGIWPFIGGFYVATLNIFNKRKAKKELQKLAEANRRGIDDEWEFNEWLHGSLGTPMGSKYQLWNAATYIMTYQCTLQGLDPKKLFKL